MSPAALAAAPRRVIVLRHGETDHNAARIWQGHLDTSLSERGLQQADAVGPAIAALSPDRIVSSDLTRARLTAESVGRACGIPVSLDPRFREIDVGAWQGLGAPEVEQGWPEVQAALTRGEDVRRGDHGETVGEVAEARRGSAHRAPRDPRAGGVPRRLHPRRLGPHRRRLAARARSRPRLAGARPPGQLPLGRARAGPQRVADPDLERLLGDAVAGRVAPALRPIWSGPGVHGYTHRRPFGGHPLGAVAQLVAHLHGMEGVRGSNPLSSTGRLKARHAFRRAFSRPGCELSDSRRSAATGSPQLHRAKNGSASAGPFLPCVRAGSHRGDRLGEGECGPGAGDQPESSVPAHTRRLRSWCTRARSPSTSPARASAMATATEIIAGLTSRRPPATQERVPAGERRPRGRRPGCHAQQQRGPGPARPRGGGVVVRELGAHGQPPANSTLEPRRRPGRVRVTQGTRVP